MNFLELERTKLRNVTVVAAKDQISADVGGEAVILNLKTGAYHGLDPVGARIWNLLAESTTVNDILDALLNEYEVEPDRCFRELLALLQQLAESGLIEVKNQMPV